MKPVRLAAFFALSMAACSDSSTPTDAGAAGDRPVVEEMVTMYTPAGCAHVVRIPDVATAVRGDTSTFGPGAAPAAVHVSWPASPATTIAALWRTDAATRASVIQYGTSRAQMNLSAAGHVMTAGNGVSTITEHEVHVCGLAPDTTYWYRVGGEGHWSDVQSFKTAPAPGRTDYDVNVAVLGDSRDDPDTFHMVQAQVLSASAMRQPDFEIFSGDAIATGLHQGLWDGWFEDAAAVMRLMPFIPVNGNHEGLAVNYLMQFALPQVGVPDQDELYFSFDYGPIHFVFLNDSPRASDYATSFGVTEVAWLRADLAAARARRAMVPWIVAVHHKGPFSGSLHTMDADTVIVRNTLPPIYDEFGVDLVLNGHDHQFEITRPLDGMGNPASGRPGTVYITSAGAGAPLYPASTMAWRQHSESVANFLLLHATNRALEVVPRRADGTVITEGRLALTPRAM